MKVRHTCDTHKFVPKGITGTIDTVSVDGTMFCLKLDRGGYFGWTSFESWELVEAAGQ